MEGEIVRHFPQDIIRGVNELNKNIDSLNNQIKELSASSNGLQEKLIFWTKVMALAIIIQAITIGIQVYLGR
ncbi:MAG: hypothetical protein AABY03_01095 [Nanoarchaeota archaeon]